MATPFVANLATKLFTLKLTLSVAQVVTLIKDGADKSSSSNVKPVNSKKSVDLLWKL